LYEDFVGKRRLTPLGFVLGPLTIFPSTFLGGSLLVVACIVLTVLTQYGGVLLWISVPVLDQFYQKMAEMGGRLPGLIFSFLIFVGIYVAFTLFAIPELAAFAGRVPLPCERASDMFLQPATRWTCFFSRRYVAPELKTKLMALATAMDKRYPGQITYYLDAGFPFARFPMFPHVAHRKGRQVDLSFAYQVEINGQKLPADPPSPTGYWAFEHPVDGEEQPCAKKKKSFWRWNVPGMASFLSDAKIDEDRTKSMIEWLLTDSSAPEVRKILLEPHLKARFGVTSDKVRFQGCKAARHDDHMHVEI
jgi:hypothetical protein